MSATGHQVLSFVTSGEIRMIVPAVTSPVLRGVIEAKEVSCVAEVVIFCFSANRAKGADLLRLSTKTNLTLS
jgi:hypothetical protein